MRTSQICWSDWCASFTLKGTERPNFNQIAGCKKWPSHNNPWKMSSVICQEA
jgi:hypothetical protein